MCSILWQLHRNKNEGPNTFSDASLVNPRYVHSTSTRPRCNLEPNTTLLSTSFPPITDSHLPAPSGVSSGPPLARVVPTPASSARLERLFLKPASLWPHVTRRPSKLDLLVFHIASYCIPFAAFTNSVILRIRCIPLPAATKGTTNIGWSSDPRFQLELEGDGIESCTDGMVTSVIRPEQSTTGPRSPKTSSPPPTPARRISPMPIGTARLRIDTEC